MKFTRAYFLGSDGGYLSVKSYDAHKPKDDGFYGPDEPTLIIWGLPEELELIIKKLESE